MGSGCSMAALMRRRADETLIPRPDLFFTTKPILIQVFTNANVFLSFCHTPRLSAFLFLDLPKDL
jgi:hypothetical protein